MKGIAKLCFALLTASSAGAQDPALEKAVDAVEQKYSVAWKAGDAAGCAALYSDDADVIGFDGVATKGKAAIQESHRAKPRLVSRKLPPDRSHRNPRGLSRRRGLRRNVGDHRRAARRGSADEGLLHRRAGQAGRHLADRRKSDESSAAHELSLTRSAASPPDSLAPPGARERTSPRAPSRREPAARTRKSADPPAALRAGSLP